MVVPLIHVSDTNSSIGEAMLFMLPPMAERQGPILGPEPAPTPEPSPRIIRLPDPLTALLVRMDAMEQENASLRQQVAALERRVERLESRTFWQYFSEWLSGKIRRIWRT